MWVRNCDYCGREYAAQRDRSPGYDSESCKQKAKRQRERAREEAREFDRLPDEFDYLPDHAKCQWCGGPAFPDDPERGVRVKRNWRHLRKYCSPRCRNAGRRFSYRVARLRETGHYRVTGPGDLDQPGVCWKSPKWHEQAAEVMHMIAGGYRLVKRAEWLDDYVGWRVITLEEGELSATDYDPPPPQEAASSPPPEPAPPPPRPPAQAAAAAAAAAAGQQDAAYDEFDRLLDGVGEEQADAEQT